MTPEILLEALRRRLPESTSPPLEAVGIVQAATKAAGELPAVLVAGDRDVEDEAALSGALRALHASLLPGGRLFWAGPATQSRALRAALPEAGFVIERRDFDGPAGAEILVARPDRFVVRGYHEGDENRILRLFEASFGVCRNRERWAWEYRDNPYGAHHISQAFDADGNLVAHYAGYPVLFHRAGTNGDERLPALQIGDTMTARDVRHIGRGTTSLLGRTVEHFRARFEGTVTFAYGFNTATSRRFSRLFLGAKEVEPVAFARRDVSHPWPGLSVRERLRGRLRVERVTDFDARFDDLFARVRGDYSLLVTRDARYLSWRYAACPNGGYARYGVYRGRLLVGWAIFRLLSERLVWGDALFDPTYPQAVGCLLERAAADHASATTIEGWLPPRPASWGATVAGLGFEPRPEPDDLSLMAAPGSWDPEEDFRRRLYYTKGDSDLF